MKDRATAAARASLYVHNPAGGVWQPAPQKVRTSDILNRFIDAPRPHFLVETTKPAEWLVKAVLPGHTRVVVSGANGTRTPDLLVASPSG